LRTFRDAFHAVEALPQALFQGRPDMLLGGGIPGVHCEAIRLVQDEGIEVTLLIQGELAAFRRTDPAEDAIGGRGDFAEVLRRLSKTLRRVPVLGRNEPRSDR